jgi:hypothetical protein
MMMLGVLSPQSIACGVGAFVSRIELYNFDRFVSFVYVLYVILLLLFTYVYYMYETRSWHTYRYALGLFSKTRCDIHGQIDQDLAAEEQKLVDLPSTITTM